MTHLLPGGGGPQVHGARSPVPPRLSLFATSRSVCCLTTVASGAYPLRRLPNAGSLGVQTLLGPCVMLVASGTPLSWRRGCLAAGLVRGSVRHYFLGGCSALFVCARRSRRVWGVGAGAGFCLVSSPFASSRRAVPAVRVAGCPVRVSLTVACWYAIPCGLCVWQPWSRALVVFPACPLRVCALALLRRPCPSSLPGSVWRAHLASFRCKAPVGPFHAVSTPPLFLPRSRAPSSLFWGGAARSCSPRAWLGVLCLLAGMPVRPERSGAGGGRGGGGRPVCRPPPPGRGRGAPRGRGWLYLGLSLCFPWAGTKAGVIGVAQFMKGVASVLLRFVFAY